MKSFQMCCAFLKQCIEQYSRLLFNNLQRISCRPFLKLAFHICSTQQEILFLRDVYETL